MYDFVYYKFVLYHLLNAAFLLDKLSSAWVRPTYSSQRLIHWKAY